MGWGPDDYDRGYRRGPMFAGKGDPSVQQGDVILIARRHKANEPHGIEVVAVGMVDSEYWIDTFQHLHPESVQLRHLEPFKPLSKVPQSIPLKRVLPY